MTTETFENNNWIVEISINTYLFGIFKIHIQAKNKKTGKIIIKEYKSSILNIKKTLEKIKNDFGEYQ